MDIGKRELGVKRTQRVIHRVGDQENALKIDSARLLELGEHRITVDKALFAAAGNR